MASPTKAELLARAAELGITDVDESTTNADLSARIAQAEDGQQDTPAPEEAPPVDEAQQNAEADGIVPDAAELGESLGQDVGYVGAKVDPRPNEAYSQESDPTTSPSAADALEAARDHRVDEAPLPAEDDRTA